MCPSVSVDVLIRTATIDRYVTVDEFELENLDLMSVNWHYVNLCAKVLQKDLNPNNEPQPHL